MDGELLLLIAGIAGAAWFVAQERVVANDITAAGGVNYEDPALMAACRGYYNAVGPSPYEQLYPQCHGVVFTP